MKIRDEKWRQCSFDEIVDRMMRAACPKSRDRLVMSDQNDLVGRLDARIAEVSNLTDPTANRERLELLRSYHAGLLDNIPDDTEWFRVEHLRDVHLHELRAISVWAKAGQGHENELPAVVEQRIRDGQPLPPMLGTPDEWPSIFLWGHGQDGPFTILDGNNRLAEYVATTNAPSFRIAVYVGLSQSRSRLHLPDCLQTRP